MGLSQHRTLVLGLVFLAAGLLALGLLAERTPQPPQAIGLALLIVGAPLAMAPFGGAGLALGLAAFAAWTAAAVAFVDPRSGLVAAAEAGGPALAAVALVGAAHRVLRRKWREQLEPRLALGVACAGVVLACVAVFHPALVPPADTHARFLEAIRADLWTAFDPTDFQGKAGAWTRTIAGHRVAFPYAPIFHLCAWPLAFLFGNAGAVKTVGVASLGLTLVLAFALARGLGAPTPWAVLTQALLLVLPVTTAALTLGLYPALLGQAMEALLGVHLLRRFGHLDGARDAAAATFFLFAAQAAYTGSLYNVGVVVLLFAAFEAAAGERRRALRLVTSWAVAAAAAVLFYARFLPTLVHEVLAHIGDGSAPGAALLPSAWARLSTSYGALLPLLALAGLVVSSAAPVHARRYVGAALLAGVLLSVLRAALPAAFRDAKDVELLALPIAALATLALRRLWEAGVFGRLAAIAALLGVLLFCIPRDVGPYAARLAAGSR